MSASSSVFDHSDGYAPNPVPVPHLPVPGGLVACCDLGKPVRVRHRHEIGALSGVRTTLDAYIEFHSTAAVMDRSVADVAQRM